MMEERLLNDSEDEILSNVNNENFRALIDTDWLIYSTEPE